MPSKLHPEDLASPSTSSRHDTETPHIFNGAPSSSSKPPSSVKPSSDTTQPPTHRQQLEAKLEQMKYGTATPHTNKNNISETSAKKGKDVVHGGKQQQNKGDVKEDEEEVWHDAVEHQDSASDEESGEVGKEGYAEKEWKPIRSRWDPRFIERA